MFMFSLPSMSLDCFQIPIAHEGGTFSTSPAFSSKRGGVTSTTQRGCATPSGES